MIRWAVSLPERLIRSRVNKPTIRLEVIILAVLGLLGSAGLVYFALEMSDALADEQQMTYLPYTLAGVALQPLGMLVAAWLWYSIAAHFITKLYPSGRGPISRLLRTSAWSLIPFGIWLLLRSVIVFVIFYQEDLPEEPDEEIILPQEMVNYYLELGLDGPLYVVVLLSSVLFIAWSWYLFSIGVEESKGVSTSQARQIAAIPAAVLALFFIRAALQWQGIL